MIFKLRWEVFQFEIKVKKEKKIKQFGHGMEVEKIN